METALRWLQELKPALAIAVLKQPELALIATRSFLGFRFNAQGYQNPVVRRRLAEEIVREPKFQEAIRAVIEIQAEQRPLPPAPSPDKGGGAYLSPALSSRMGAIGGRTTPQSFPYQGEGGGLVASLKDQLRAEREQRKRDRSEARAAIDEVRKTNESLARDVDERGAALSDALAEVDTLREALTRAEQRIARIERQNARMKIEAELLTKAAKPVSTSARPAPRSNAQAQPPGDTRSPFEAAAYRLVSQENLDAALALAEAALTEEPGNTAALEIATTIYQKTGRRDRAAQTARDLVLAALETSNLKAATEALLTLLTVDPMSGLIGTVSRPYVQALRTAEPEQIQDIATTLARFSATHPAVYRRLVRLIDEYVPADIARALTRGSAAGPNASLPLQMPQPMTAAAIVDAVDRSDEQTVDALRTALSQLREASPDHYGRAISAIADAAGGDETYLKPLIGRPRGPVIVDASNVAWYDDAKGMADRPRLAQILKVREAMRRRGYFPILLIGDAPLPYTVDDREAFARMMATGEVTLSTTGTDADETILREARRIGAVVVSNDYMADWDPAGEVEKLRYVIPSGGPAYLLG